MVANYVNKIGVQNIDGTYSYQDIGTDSDHIEVDATGKKLSAKLTELENATPDVATSSTPGIVKPGTGMEIDGTGALNLTYDHTLTLAKEDGTVIDTYDGSTDKTISVATIPTDHSSVNTTYGVATTGKYGHVKVVDTYQTEPGATNGTVASATALHEAYKELKAGTGIHKTQAEYNALPESEKKNGSTYYVDDGKDGTLTSDNVAYDNSVSGLSAEYVKTAIDELAVKSAKPTPHPSSVATTYGAGTGSEFGHVRLSDSYKASDGNADASVAASSYALYQAYNELNSKLSVKGNEYKDITTDFDNGTFSANLDKYNPGNYIKKAYGGVTYVAVLADFNTFYNPGRNDYANIQSNHWTSIIFGFAAGQMNTTNTTNGGYKGSAMHTWLMGDATAAVKNAFGTSHLIAHQCLLSNGTYNASSVTHGFSWEWVPDVYLVLPSEAQLGYRGWSDLGWSTGEAYKTLDIFQNESFMSVFGRNYGQSNNNFNTSHAWLRDISASSPGTNFCFADYNGNANYSSASNTAGRFPLAILK